jgi:hypothetical protein
MSEVALGCGDANGNVPPPLVNYCLSTDFETTKAYYLVQTYAAAIAEGLRASLWYSVFGWRNSELLNTDNSPTLAYTAFQFVISKLSNAAYAGDIIPADIGGASGVKGYKFLRSGHRIWVVWSLDGSTHSIHFSGVPLGAWDALGNSVSTATSMNLTLEPLYLEWNP